MLAVGTTSGMHLLSLATFQTSRHLLRGCLVTHVTASDSAIAAAVPVLGPVHSMLPLDTSPPSGADVSGVHLIRLQSDGTPSGEPEHVWHGDARSVGLQPNTSRLFVGT
jgi:hypothetical protein